MREFVEQAARREARKRLAILATTARITFAPSAFTDELARAPANIIAALKYFFAAVGIILVIETAFSFLFDTAFSDLVHNLFPIFVAFAGGLTIYLLLKLLLTRTATFARTLETSFYVGGAALFVMISLIFALLTADFAANYHSVMTSGCTHRTIMCLLSGNTQSDYGLMQDVATRETQGASYPIILLVMLASFAYFAGVLAYALRRLMGVPLWRTLLASFVALILLTIPALLAINTIYKALYPAG